MSVLYMGIPFGDDVEMKEGLKDDARDDRNNGVTESAGTDGFDLRTEFGFWPIEHPTEPSREDRPIQCPIPHSSHLIKDERMQVDQFSERKRPEGSMNLAHKEPPIRAVRKRHHDHTKTVTPLLQMPPAYPYLHHNMNPTGFNKIQQPHRFSSS